MYYGVQTPRAVNNFDISTAKLNHYRTFIRALGAVKKAAGPVNHELDEILKPENMLGPHREV